MEGINLLVAGLEEVQGLINMGVDVAWDFVHCLWSYIIEIEGKKEVINLTRFVLGRQCKIYPSKHHTFLRKRARHLWFMY